MMKTFQQFLTEVYDKELSTATRQPGEGGRVRASRKKTDSEIRRVKAVGGGKTAPVQSYKDRKDIGTQKSRSQREQQPEKERGTAGLSAREQQRKAAMERRAARSGVKTKTASELLATKKKQTVDPKYKPQKASGMTQSEREALTKRGEKKLRDIRLQTTGKTKESELKYPITKKEIARRRKASK
jgi:predicted SPOUT superfamily RNA methylase MTH1